MTPDDQQFILQAFMSHLADNRGNRVTDVVAHGFMNVLTEITNARLDKPAQDEAEKKKE
jgi:hypothetical protein